MVLHYAVVLYTRLAPYRDNYLLLSYDNFYVKARKIYKFFEGGCRGILKASTGQVCSFGTGPKSFLESPYSLSKNFMRERGRATQGQSRLLEAHTSRQKLYVLEEKGLRWTQAVKVEFGRVLIVLYL